MMILIIRLIYARILEAQKNRTKSIELLESLSKTMPEGCRSLDFVAIPAHG